MSPGRTQWVGDLKRCFLLDNGWTFRVEVNYFLLEDKGGWRLPLSFAEQLAIGDQEQRALEPINPALGQPLQLWRGKGTLTGGPIGTALEHLEADEGDLLFVSVRDDRYDLTHRPTTEVDPEDDLGHLLWSCGLPPRDSALRQSPWRRLGLALGGSGGGIADVRRRLERRRDTKLLDLVEAIERDPLIATSGEVWPSGWPHIAPLVEETTLYALQGQDGSARVAIGVTDAMRQPPLDTTPTEGGLCWLEQTDGLDEAGVHKRLADSGPGLVPSARNARWSTWLRVEHAARRSALAGCDWSILHHGDRTWESRTGVGSFLEALAAEPSEPDGTPVAPNTRIRAAYPRSATAFEFALKEAETRGFRELRSDRLSGFRAVYADGSQRTGCALHDAFA